MDGLEGSKKEEGNEAAAPVPADLHPPLIVDKGARAPSASSGTLFATNEYDVETDS